MPATNLDYPGMLPPHRVAPLRQWLQELAHEAAGRSELAPWTLKGSVRALAGLVGAVAQTAREQERAAKVLRSDPEAAYRDTSSRIPDATRDGALLRGEILARWQDFVGTGEFFRILNRTSAVCVTGRALFRGEPAPAVQVDVAIETGLQAVILVEAANDAEETDRRWRSDPAGRHLLGPDDLSDTGPAFAGSAAASIRAWQAALMEPVPLGGPRQSGLGQMPLLRRQWSRACLLNLGMLGGCLVLLTDGQWARI